MKERRFKLPEIGRPTNPLTGLGVKALAIVLAAILLISAIAYLNIIRQRKEISPVLPATTTQEEVTTELEPTEMPTVIPTEEPTPTPVPEETPASPASPRGEPAGEPTATVSPTTTELEPTD